MVGLGETLGSPCPLAGGSTHQGNFNGVLSPLDIFQDLSKMYFVGDKVSWTI